jgi:hypothetical protein
MKEFIEKLIASLEDNHRTIVTNDEDLEWNRAVYSCTEIVNELAEEHKDNVIIDEQYCWQTCGATEHCKECNRLCNGSIDYYENYDFMAEEYKLFGNSEQVNGGWIPCDDRLPDEHERVLVTYEDRYMGGGVIGVCDGMYIQVFGGTWSISAYCNNKCFTVLAWQPLPAPYNPKGE